MAVGGDRATAKAWNLPPLGGQAVPLQMSPSLKGWGNKSFSKSSGKRLVFALLDMRGEAGTAVLRPIIGASGLSPASSPFRILYNPFDLGLLIPPVCLSFCLFPASFHKGFGAALKTIHNNKTMKKTWCDLEPEEHTGEPVEQAGMAVLLSDPFAELWFWNLPVCRVLQCGVNGGIFFPL